MKDEMMPTKAKPNGGATKPRQFRFTDDELRTIDRIAREIQIAREAKGLPPVTVSRTDVLRAGVSLMAAKHIKDSAAPAR